MHILIKSIKDTEIKYLFFVQNKYSLYELSF